MKYFYSLHTNSGTARKVREFAEEGIAQELRRSTHELGEHFRFDGKIRLGADRFFNDTWWRSSVHVDAVASDATHVSWTAKSSLLKLTSIGLIVHRGDTEVMRGVLELGEHLE